MKLQSGLLRTIIKKSINNLALVATIAVFAAGQNANAATFTIANKCNQTVYVGAYTSNGTQPNGGGWAQAANTSSTITVAATFNGRFWGRKNCNTSTSPYQCDTGQCGGTGVQCAGTTGVAGTSLAEFNLDASGTDWYDVSLVDGYDFPIGITPTNAATDPTCTADVISACPTALQKKNSAGTVVECMSPCSVYNTDQYCCRNAYGTSATCVTSAWPAPGSTWISTVHADCPHEYAYAYDDPVGLWTTPTGGNYTITFCPNGVQPGGGTTGGTTTGGTTTGGTTTGGTTTGGTIANGFHTLTPKCATGSRLDAYGAGTANGTNVDIWASNGSAAQSWNFANIGGTNFNIAVSNSPAGGACLDVAGAGSANGTNVELYQCNGTSAQNWNAVKNADGSYQFKPACAPNSCLDVYSAGSANGTNVDIWQCNATTAQQWTVN
jgi:hypothetical protein